MSTTSLTAALRLLTAEEIAALGDMNPPRRGYRPPVAAALDGLRDSLADLIERKLEDADPFAVFNISGQEVTAIIDRFGNSLWEGFTALNLAAHPDFDWADVPNANDADTVRGLEIATTGWFYFARSLLNRMVGHVSTLLETDAIEGEAPPPRQ